MNRHIRVVAALCLALGLHALVAWSAEPTVESTITAIVDRLTATVEPAKLLQIDQATVDSLLTPDDRRVLATRYWYFDVNVPAIVSVMRDVAQPVVPYWLPESGFTKTELRVRNEEYEYEVWQKRFDSGRVELGINGFDKHRPHYFVCVGPQNAGDSVELANLFPSNFSVIEMRKGAMTYHDWSDLVLTEVPDSLVGHKLLTTIRGRAREAQLIGAFRETPFPASDRPDQVALTWNDDPKTTQSIQWRTKPSLEDGQVRYREKSSQEWKEAPAQRLAIEDKFLINDRHMNRFTASLTGLKPGTTYDYAVGSPAANLWTEPAQFTTAPATPAPFTFLFLSDTHNKPGVQPLLAKAVEQHPDAAFCTISGDLIDTGQYRDDWDKFFEYVSLFARTRPLVPALGNHDGIDGLGADLYLSLFALPRNGAAALQPERSYSLEYGNALVVVLDCTDVIENQVAWLDKVLGDSKATWKFAVFHFPPYSREEEYADIRSEWGALFDKHHVDFVLSGHVHNYQRTHPMKAGQIMPSPSNGTIYLTSISIPWRPRRQAPDYAAAIGDTGNPLYVAFKIDGPRLTLQATDDQGAIHDDLTIEK